MSGEMSHSTVHGESPSLYHLKRMVLWVSLPLGILASLVGWIANDFGRGGDFYNRVSLPAFALSLGLYLLVLSFGGRGGLRWSELGVFWSVALLMIFNLYFNLLVLAREGVWLTALWMGLVFLFAHYVYEPGMALRVSAGLFVALLVSGWAALLPQVRAGIWFDPNVVVQIYGSQLIYLLLTRLLVAYREQADRLRLQTETLHHLAHTDPLTGLANRRSVRQALAAELTGAGAQGSVSLILLDLDRFKQINDRYGHEVGDRVLVHVAELLRAHSRKGDQVGRWGGEEFVILLPSTPSRATTRSRPALAWRPRSPTTPQIRWSRGPTTPCTSPRGRAGTGWRWRSPGKPRITDCHRGVPIQAE